MNQQAKNIIREVNGIIHMTPSNDDTKVILVDREVYDAKELGKYRWAIASNGYVRSQENNIRFYLHRKILADRFTPEKPLADHKNGNRLDNTLANLRPCSKHENNCNKPPNPGRLKCIKELKPNHFRIRVGNDYDYADTLLGAKRRYNEISRRHYGEFAYQYDV